MSDKEKVSKTDPMWVFENYSGAAELIDELEAERDQLRAEVERLTTDLEAANSMLIETSKAGIELRAQLAQQQGVPEGWKLVPVEPTEEMVSAAEEAHMPFGDMDIALRMAMLAAAPAPAGWVPVTERLPESERTVLAYYLNSHGKGRRIRAEYIAAKTKGADDGWDSDSPADYDEATDQYYWPAGWYEVIDNWDDLTHMAIHEGDVTHWMPLPAAPSAEGGE